MDTDQNSLRTCPDVSYVASSEGSRDLSADFWPLEVAPYVSKLIGLKVWTLAVRPRHGGSNATGRQGLHAPRHQVVLVKSARRYTGKKDMRTRLAWQAKSGGNRLVLPILRDRYETSCADRHDDGRVFFFVPPFSASTDFSVESGRCRDRHSRFREPHARTGARCRQGSSGDALSARPSDHRQEGCISVGRYKGFFSSSLRFGRPQCRERHRAGAISFARRSCSLS